MRTILHISDIHFGKERIEVMHALVQKARLIAPHLAVISGDLTQHARVVEFQGAQDFLRKLSNLGIRTLAIPGNHDIYPLYTPFKRIKKPFERYARFIAPLAQDSYRDSEIALLGVNTVRASRFAGGRFSKRDVAQAEAWFAEMPESRVRFIVTHHPLDMPEDYPQRRLATWAEQGIYALAKSNIDVYLSGHYHQGSALHTARRYRLKHRTALAIQAGTVSMRTRGEPESFNAIEVSRNSIRVDKYEWVERRRDFALANSEMFIFSEDGWVPVQIEEFIPRLSP